MAIRTPVGTIIEIPLDSGLAYAQVTHFHKKWGYLLRVFARHFTARPDDFEALVQSEVQFSTFYAAPAAVRLGLVSIAGRAKVAAHNSDFPVFKATFPGVGFDEPDKWFLWDGEREWRVEGLLSPEQRRYPWRGALTGDLLHKLAAKGWTDASDHP